MSHGKHILFNAVELGGSPLETAASKSHTHKTERDT